MTKALLLRTELLPGDIGAIVASFPAFALLHETVTDCRGSGFASIHAWTVRSLHAAARLYKAAGFRVLEEQPGQRWGVDVVEQCYGLDLHAS